MGWISWLLIGLAIIVLICLGVGAFREKQDPGAHKSRGMIAGIPFDPEKQEAVIRSSICTGERWRDSRTKRTGTLQRCWCCGHRRMNSISRIFTGWKK